MTVFRSRRLETLLGAPLAEVTYAAVAGLVEARVQEGQDLEFKSELYGTTDSKKRDLAGDVAGLANTSGGLIVLGIAEDGQAHAAGTPGVDLAAAPADMIRQTLASIVAPLLQLDVVPVPDPDRPGLGFVLIAVPRSPDAPHCVIVNNGMRYPHRSGTVTTWLTEAEVAAAYRARFVGLQSGFDALIGHERDLTRQLDVEDLGYVVVTLVPDLPGRFVINTASVQAFRDFMNARPPLFLDQLGQYWWEVISVGSNRLTASAKVTAEGAARWVSTELHTNGAGSFAAAVGRSSGASTEDADGTPDTTAVLDVIDEAVIDGLLSGVRLLAQHARDRTAAAGSVSIRATIYPVSARQPVRLAHYRSPFGRVPSGRRVVTEPPFSVAVGALEDLTEDGPALLSVIYTLASGLFHGCGLPEANQLTPAGELRIPYWSRSVHTQLREWAGTHGITVLDS